MCTKLITKLPNNQTGYKVVLLGKTDGLTYSLFFNYFQWAEGLNSSELYGYGPERTFHCFKNQKDAEQFATYYSKFQIPAQTCAVIQLTLSKKCYEGRTDAMDYSNLRTDYDGTSNFNGLLAVTGKKADWNGKLLKKFRNGKIYCK